MNIQDEIKNNNNRIKSICDEMQAYMRLAELVGNIDLSDISHSNVCMSGDKLIASLSLDSDHKDSRIAHKLAQRLHVTFEKRQSYWNHESLNYVATTDAYQITIQGAVPKTCHIVETETPLTDEEIEAAQQTALASVKTVRVTRELVCK